MKIEIMSGQSGVEIEKRFDELIEKCENIKGKILIFPERNIFQQRELYDNIVETTQNCIKSNRDLFIQHTLITF